MGGLVKWLAVGVVYYLIRSIYRLFFHPLARIPGPSIAALSSTYEFYWDCIKSGRYHTKINELHEKYGPIVRINPWEVHINDPSFVDVLYNNSKLDKDPFYYRCFGVDSASFSTSDHNTYRMRREPMGPFFSKSNVRKLQSRVLARVQQLCNRITEFAANDQPLCVSDAYRCLAADVVTDFAMPETKTLLAHPHFAPDWVKSIRDLSATIIWNRHIRIITPILRSIPRAVVAALDRTGGILGIVDMDIDVQNQAKMAHSGLSSKSHPTVLTAISTSPSLPAHERSIQRLADETLSFMAAGSETTGAALAHLTYHVLTCPRILQRLRAELDAAAEKHGVPPTELFDCSVVEGLPYLTALMKETLRYSTPITGRLPRRNPIAPMSYTSSSSSSSYTSSSSSPKTYTIPPGFAISMTPRDMHFNPTIFPSPFSFLPERWLSTEANAAQLTHMNKYFLAFGKGARICLGMELAKQEILLVAANLLHRYDFELYETGKRDVEYVHDFFGSWAGSGSKGVRVKARAR